MDLCSEFGCYEVRSPSRFYCDDHHRQGLMTKAAMEATLAARDLKPPQTESQPQNPGYHVSEIKRGTFGELSKVQEELAEALDAEAQDCRVMLLVELSDMVGAITGYLEAKFPGMSIQDLVKMSEVTQRAFQSGNRQARE